MRKKTRGFLFVLLILFPALLLSGSSYREPLIARLQYGGGGDWYSGPSKIPNLIDFVERNTILEPCREIETVTLRDNKIFSYPIIYMTGHGNLRFSTDEIELLRRYLKGGGFLFADDDFGMDPAFRREMKRVFPEPENQLTELPFSHKIFSIYYSFPEGLPKVHEHYGGPPVAYGIFYNGRMVVFYSYNTDLGNGWEDQPIHGNPEHIREAALKMGANVLLYAMTH